MAQLWELVPDVDVLLQLPPEELGGMLLQVMNTDAEQRMSMPTGFVTRLFTPQERYPRSRQNQVFSAIAEAWAWLEAQVLIVAPDDSNGKVGWRVPSRRGALLDTEKAFQDYRKVSMFPKELLHPAIANKVWLLFMRGDHDIGVLQAFKEVEIAVRAAGGFSEADYGVALMRKAFKPETGPLTISTAPGAEQEAVMALFAGAIGYYKNPQSHRKVGITDASEAAEMIMLASHLLRIIEARRSH